jgi:hypothetical protein
MTKPEEKNQTSSEFLNDVVHNAPLYSKRIFEGDIRLTSFKSLENTNFYCYGACKSEQTFKVSLVSQVKDASWGGDGLNLLNVSTADYTSAQKTLLGEYEILGVHYKCAKCQECIHSFILKIERSGVSGKRSYEVRKVGQDPAAEQQIDKELRVWLSDNDAALFQKGLRTEAYGFGIAAYSYYRRIVEDNIEKLLVQISGHSDSEELKNAITTALKQNNAAERIKLVKDHAPSSLKPAGKNVFNVLYKALSAGIHTRTDDECLKDANDIKVCLMFLITRISREKAEADKVSNSIKALSR